MMGSLSLCLSRKMFSSPFLKNSFARYSIPRWSCFFFSTLNTSFHSLPAFKVSIDKFLVCEQSLLCWCPQILFLSLFLDNLILTYLMWTYLGWFWLEVFTNFESGYPLSCPHLGSFKPLYFYLFVLWRSLYF